MLELSKNEISTYLEIPISINYAVNNNISLTAGMASSVGLSKSSSNRLIDNIRFGVLYNW